MCNPLTFPSRWPIVYAMLMAFVSLYDFTSDQIFFRTLNVQFPCCTKRTQQGLSSMSSSTSYNLEPTLYNTSVDSNGLVTNYSLATYQIASCCGVNIQHMDLTGFNPMDTCRCNAEIRLNCSYSLTHPNGTLLQQNFSVDTCRWDDASSGYKLHRFPRTLVYRVPSTFSPGLIRFEQVNLTTPRRPRTGSSSNSTGNSTLPCSNADYVAMHNTFSEIDNLPFDWLAGVCNVCFWSYVQCRNDTVVEIDMLNPIRIRLGSDPAFNQTTSRFNFPIGRAYLSLLPPTLQTVKLHITKRVTVNFSALPRALEHLEVTVGFGHFGNLLEIVGDFSSLPPNMTFLSIKVEAYWTTVDIAPVVLDAGLLPRTLTHMDLKQVPFEGVFVLIDLPSSLVTLNLESSRFSKIEIGANLSRHFDPGATMTFGTTPNLDFVAFDSNRVDWKVRFYFTPESTCNATSYCTPNIPYSDNMGTASGSTNPTCGNTSPCGLLCTCRAATRNPSRRLTTSAPTPRPTFKQWTPSPTFEGGIYVLRDAFFEFPGEITDSSFTIYSQSYHSSIEGTGDPARCVTEVNSDVEFSYGQAELCYENYRCGPLKHEISDYSLVAETNIPCSRASGFILQAMVGFAQGAFIHILVAKELFKVLLLMLFFCTTWAQQPDFVKFHLTCIVGFIPLMCSKRYRERVRELSRDDSQRHTWQLLLDIMGEDLFSVIITIWVVVEENRFSALAITSMIGSGLMVLANLCRLCISVREEIRAAAEADVNFRSSGGLPQKQIHVSVSHGSSWVQSIKNKLTPSNSNQTTQPQDMDRDMEEVGLLQKTDIHGLLQDVQDLKTNMHRLQHDVEFLIEHSPEKPTRELYAEDVDE